MLFIQPGNLWKWYVMLTIVFALVISFNFTKPFGFFRESNPTLVAINATYWQQHPDIRKQNIPVASYAFNKRLPPSTQFDNTITTFGFGWFAVPYYFLQFTHLAATPVSLRIFSVLWLVLTVVIIHALARQLTKHLSNSPFISFLTVCLYLFSAVVMWYQVNGYVHETAVLPFYYLGWYFFAKLLSERKNKWLWFTAASVFIAIQFDWLPFFQACIMSVYLLFSTKEKLPRWMFLIPGAAVLTGIACFVAVYISWSSVADYRHFMEWKFLSRTVGIDGHSFLGFWPVQLNLVLFYIISYGILLVWTMMGVIKKIFPSFLLLMVITATLHHIAFWGFSSEHDYATLKMAFPIVLLAAIYLSQAKKRVALASITTIMVVAIGQYIALHHFSYRKGMYANENFFVSTGHLIQSLPAKIPVFVNTENKYFPQLEYYSQRPYKMAVSEADARQQMKILGWNTAFFVNTQGKAVALKP